MNPGSQLQNRRMPSCPPEVAGYPAGHWSLERMLQRCLFASKLRTNKHFLHSLKNFIASPRQVPENLHILPNKNTHPALPSPKPRLNLDYLKWHRVHSIRLNFPQFPSNFMGKCLISSWIIPSIAGNSKS